MNKKITIDDVMEDITNCMYDRDWCRQHELVYHNLDIAEVYKIRITELDKKGYRIPKAYRKFIREDLK